MQRLHTCTDSLLLDLCAPSAGSASALGFCGVTSKFCGDAGGYVLFRVPPLGKLYSLSESSVTLGILSEKASGLPLWHAKHMCYWHQSACRVDMHLLALRYAALVTSI